SPRGGVLLKSETTPDARKAVARGPAHGRRISGDARAAAKLPDTGVGLKRLIESRAPELLQHGIERFVAFARQALVEEERGGGRHDAAVNVMLHLISGGVADAHRAVAVEPR